MAMTLVSTTTVGSGGAASIEFTNIPQTGKDLLVLMSLRSARAAIDDPINLKLNSSSADFTARELVGLGNSAESNTRTNRLYYTSAANSTSNTFGNAALYVSNYTASANKSMSTDGVSENNGTTAYQVISAGLWSNSAAITSLLLETNTANNFVQHSTASLYIIS